MTRKILIFATVAILTVLFGMQTAWGQLNSGTYEVVHYYPGYKGASDWWGTYENGDALGNNYIYFHLPNNDPYCSLSYGIVDCPGCYQEVSNPSTSLDYYNGDGIGGIKPQPSWNGQRIKIWASNAGITKTIYIRTLKCHPQITSPNNNSTYCAGQQVTVEVNSNSTVTTGGSNFIDGSPSLLRYVYIDSYNDDNNTSFDNGHFATVSYVSGGSVRFTFNPTNEKQWVKFCAQNRNGEWGIPRCIKVNTPPTSPTSITGTNTICTGGSTTLTAYGGSAGDGCTYQWYSGGCGSGSVLGTGQSIDVNLTSNTTYYVRRVGTSPCNTTTSCASVTVTVAATITQNNPASATINSGASHTFTLEAATGGIGAITYNWQQSANGSTWTDATGTRTGQNYTTPALTSNMYYRRQATNICGGTINSNSALVMVNASFTQDNPLAVTICNNTSHTFSLAAATGGSGIITYQWEQSSNNSTWSNATGTSTNASYTTPNLTSNMYYRRKATTAIDGTITSNSALVTVNTPPTAPAGISGTTTINLGQSITLTATGGSDGSGAIYQWGTGTCGNNIISGQTGSSITVSPTTTTTYWVRRVGTSPCNSTTTTCATKTVTISAPCDVPLLTTKWSQGAPYNNEVVSRLNGLGYSGDYPTGCVATAIAQIMKKWKHPTQRTQSIPAYSYTTSPSSGITITIPSITGTTNYDWDNMLDTYPYSNSGNPTQQSAIAKLMYECGVAVKMKYTTNSSGSNIDAAFSALSSYFGYNCEPPITRQPFNTTNNANWENTIKTELEAGRPVYYRGEDARIESGHAWVCDGYKCGDNTFHFNWGWGVEGQVKYNGYYVTTILNPDNGNCPGGVCEFISQQKIIIGIEPKDSDFLYPTSNDNINTFVITGNVGPGGSIVPSGNIYVYLNENQPYTFSSDSGYEIDQVFIDGISNTTAKANGYYIFENITANHSIIVTFKQKQFSITATAGSGGNITPSGIQTVNYGSHITFIATPNDYYEVDKWTVDGNVVPTSGTIYTVSNIHASTTISVTFKQKQFTITATAGNGGSISPNGASTVICGNSITYYITPNSGYRINEVLVDGVNVGAVSSYTFNNVTANRTIDAYFAVNTLINFTNFMLDDGAEIALYRTVDLNYTFNGGVPTHFRVAESAADLNGGVPWILYNSSALTYSFASAEVYGLKTVYTQLKNDISETPVKSASIFYKPFYSKTVGGKGLNAKLFPNPAENYLNVVVEDETLPVQVTIYSITGETYLSQTFDTLTFGIDLSRYPTGTLLVQITCGDKYVVKQIIKL